MRFFVWSTVLACDLFFNIAMAGAPIGYGESGRYCSEWIKFFDLVTKFEEANLADPTDPNVHKLRGEVSAARANLGWDRSRDINDRLEPYHPGLGGSEWDERNN